MKAVRVAMVLFLGAGIALPDWRASMASTALGALQSPTVPDVKSRPPSAATSPDRAAPIAGPAGQEAQRDLATALRKLADLEAAHELLRQRQAATDERLDRIEADVAEIRRRVQRQEVSQARLRRQSVGSAVQQKLPAAAPAASAPEPPQVLSVDVWNGRPSVSALVGGQVQFLAEGDVAAGAIVRRADAATQHVEFVGLPAGAVVASSAALRN